MSELAVRILLGVLVSLLFMAHYLWVGDQWRRSSIYVNVGRIGLAGVFVYVLTGQLKAVRLDVPVDWTTWVGVLGCALGAFGFSTEVVRRFRRHRPKSGE